MSVITFLNATQNVTFELPGYDAVLKTGSALIAPGATVPFSRTLQSPVITTPAGALAAGTVGMTYSQALSATGGTPIAWSVASGALPAGLSLDPAAGVISGTPTTPGTFNFTVQAANAVGSDTRAFSIRITAQPQSTPTRPPSRPPQTGDRFPMGMLLGLMGISIVGMGWMGYRARRKRRA